MSAREFIEKALASCQRALDDYDKGNDQGIRLSKGDIHFVRDRINAAEILIDEELKELSNK